MSLPEDLAPDAEGRLACATCHGDPEIADRPADQVDPNHPRFLRGGPYREPNEFCVRCHDPAPLRRLNVHVQLDARGEPDRARCEYCHLEAPDPADPPERPRLRLPPERLCLGCHLKTPHLNALEHGGTPDEEMAERLREAARREGVRLPLDGQGRVTCITCHSPHPPGVIPEDRPAGRMVSERAVDEGPRYRDSRWAPVYAADKQGRLAALGLALGRTPRLGYRRLEAEVLVRLPARDGTLCRACHAFED